MTYNPTYEHRTLESIKLTSARHASLQRKKKPGFLQRFKMDTTPQPNTGPPYVETLTDVARDIQYYAEGGCPFAEH